jgi:CRISPR system Cascade subunit CasB
MTGRAEIIDKSPADHGVVGYLKGLANAQDRAALAHLRRGLGRKPGESMEMYSYVGRFVGEKTSRGHDRAVFLTAALFADYWDAAQSAGNLGHSVKMLSLKTRKTLCRVTRCRG